MKKEMVIAIILGLILGGGAAAALVKMPIKFASSTQPTPTMVAQTEETSPTPPSSQSLTLDILLPENQALVQESEVTISGKTKSNALVAISSPIDEKVTTAQDDGTFSERIKLEEGSNEILIVTSFNGLEAEKRLVVNYTRETF